MRLFGCTIYSFHNGSIIIRNANLCRVSLRGCVFKSSIKEGGAAEEAVMVVFLLIGMDNHN